MSCKSCGQITNGVCKVCALLENDTTIKKVSMCDFCGVMICETCMPNIERRWVAFVKAKKGALKEHWNNLVKSWTS